MAEIEGKIVGYENDVLAITVDGVNGDNVKVSFHCKACGGYILDVRGKVDDMAMAHCRACGVWLGRLAAIRVHAALAVEVAGFKVDRDALFNEPGQWRIEHP